MLFFAMYTFIRNQNYPDQNNKSRESGSSGGEFDNGMTTTKAELNKDLYHIVTAASSLEFQPLLKLIDSLKNHASGFDLLVWSLDLRACELNYLSNLKAPFRHLVNEFPFHFHPLHIRSFHMAALKPIIVEISVQSFGQLLWIDPTSVVTKDPLPLPGRLADNGFVVSAMDPSSRSVCTGEVVGFNYLSDPYNNVLKPWAKCAKTRACILSYMNKTRTVNDGVDPLLQAYVAKAKLRCTPTDVISAQASFNGGPFPNLARWKTSESKLCSRHKGCVLTGNHLSYGCLTPQLARLRQNKQKYATHHGYSYLEETHGFHRHAPCHRVWNKVHAVLKYLVDCEVLLWIDTEAVFTNMNKSLESFFDVDKGKELFVSWPKSDKILNAGVLLMRSTQAIRDFFVNVTSGNTWTQDWCRKMTLEQSAINDQLQTGSLNGKYVMKHNNRFLQSLCGYRNGGCVWTETDFIAHFAPPACPELVDVVRDFLDKHPQFTQFP